MKWWKVLTCPVCGRKKRTRRSAKTCGRRCGAVLVKIRNGNAWHEQNGQRAGAAFARNQADRTIANWQAKYPGIPEQAITEIRAQGYNSGFRRGYATGFSTAVGERKKRVIGQKVVTFPQHRQEVAS